MRRAVAVILAVAAATAFGCTRASGKSAGEFGESDILSLYSSGGAVGPVTKLGLASTTLKDALLVSPHDAIEFSRWAVTPELTDEQFANSDVRLDDIQGLPAQVDGRRAPKGHELFIVDAGNPTTVPISNDDALNKTAFTLVVGGESRPLGHSLFAFNTRNALMAVIPKGADVRLDMTDEGRTQSLNLRTGMRTNAAAAFYPMRETVVSPTEAGRSKTGIYTLVDAQVVATLTPWTKEKGWAPVGRAWLTGKVSVTTSSAKRSKPTEPIQTPVAIRADLGKDLRVSGTGVPQRLFPAGTPAFVVDLVNDADIPDEAKSKTFTIEVPESLQKFTVEFTPDLVDAGYVRDTDLSDGPQEATLNAKGH